MEAKIIRSHALWIVERHAHLVTDPQSIRGLEAFRRYASGEITKEELAKAHEDTLEVLRIAEERLRKSKRNWNKLAHFMVYDELDGAGKTDLQAGLLALVIANEAVERARMYMTKAVSYLISGCETPRDIERIAKVVAHAVREMAYFCVTNSTAKKILNGSWEFYQYPYHLWEAAEEAAFMVERSEQKKEWLRLLQKAENEKTAKVA